jgi:hypothetical protein
MENEVVKAPYGAYISMKESRVMTTFPKRLRPGATALILAVLLGACESSDVIAPDGATISLTSNPATIILSGGVQSADVEITATVSNSIGVPLPDQDVRFTTTAGTLTPPGGTPVTTNDDGNAITILSDARQPPTITARSGKATATLQLQTATCSLSAIALSPSSLQLNTCNDTFNVSAVATDTSGAPCSGILVSFTITGSAPTTDVAGSFNPGSDTTDSTGLATSLLTINSTDCNSKCVAKSCTGFIKATSGSTSSSNVSIVDNVP